MLTDKPVPASLELAQELSQSEEPVLRGYQQMEQFKVPSGFRGRSKLYVQLWWLVQSTLFAMSPQMMYGWRDSLSLEADCREPLSHRRRCPPIHLWGD